MNIIVVRFVSEEEWSTDEIVGAATSWDSALVVAREHMMSRLTYNELVNISRDTLENRTRDIQAGQYVMTNVEIRQA